MSVQSLSHFIVRMAVDYNKLSQYLSKDEDGDFTETFIPTFEGEETPRKLKARYGDLTPRECQLIRNRDWNEMFNYLEAEGPKPMTRDPLNYP